jgi:outer membrane protein TolC
MKTKTLHILIFLWISAYSFGQEILTIQDAVSITLENNFEIKIAKNELDIDQINNTIGNAGMLPSISAALINNNTVQNATLQQANGNEIDIDGARNFNINYGLGLEWTIFDGFKMFSRKKQLQQMNALGEKELQFAILSKISQVYSNYFELVNIQKQLKTLDSIIEVSKFRLETAQNRYTIGKVSKLEVLNAEVDLNSDLSSQVQLKEQYGLSKIRLNQLLSRAPETDFIVNETVIVDTTLELSEILDMASEQNPMLQTQFINQKIQELALKQIKADRWPTFTINSGYDLVRSQSPFGFITAAEGRNLTYGFSARLNLFDGFNQNRNEKVAAKQLENTSIALAQQKLDIASQITAMYQTYLSNLALLALEEKNKKIAAQNLDITLEKFKIGTIPAIEFRAAQVNYAQAMIRIANAQFLAKQSEISLKELAGNLNF